MDEKKVKIEIELSEKWYGLLLYLKDDSTIGETIDNIIEEWKRGYDDIGISI